MKTTKKIWRVFLPIILILSMLPNVSLRVYANTEEVNSITLEKPTSVVLSPSDVRTQIPFTVSAKKSDRVENISLWFEEGTLTYGSNTIPFKVNANLESYDGGTWTSFTFQSDRYEDILAVIVDSDSRNSANEGVYTGFLQWTANFLTPEKDRIEKICGQIPVTLKVGYGYDITVSSNNYGTVSASCAMARAGETVTLTAVPNEGCHFKEWQIISGDVTIENNQFIMPEGDVEICAIFEQVYEATFDANGGTGSMEKEFIPVTDNTTYILPACGFTAPTGMAFKEWEVEYPNGSRVLLPASSKVQNITDNLILHAQWSESIVNTNVSPAGSGTVAYDMINGTFTATAKEGYTFDHWEYADDEYSTAPIGTVWPTDNPYHPTEVKHKIYTAVFKAKTYNLTVLSNNNERGTVSYIGTPKTGSTITLKATANEGYIFKEWRIEPNGIAINLDNKFKMPANDVTVTAVFVSENQETYTVTVNNGSGSGSYVEGDSVTIAADTPEPGKQFKEWTGVDGLTFTNANATSASATFTMPANAVTLTATYKDLDEASITATDKNYTYVPGATYDVSQMFSFGSGTGTPTYSIVTGENAGTGAGTLSGDQLTITKAGTIKVKVNTAATANVSAGEATAVLTVAKADAVITIADDKNSYAKKYGDNAFVLGGITTNVGNAQLAYTVTAGSDVVRVSDSGVVTLLKPGTATVTVSLPGTDNYNAATPQTVIVTVARGEAPKTKPSSTMTVAYSVDKVGSVSLPAGWTWASSDRDKTLTAGGSITVTAEYTASDRDYYNGGLTATVTITGQSKPSGGDSGNDGNGGNSGNSNTSNDSNNNSNAQSASVIPEPSVLASSVIPVIPINNAQTPVLKTPINEITDETIHGSGEPFIKGYPDSNGWELIKESIQDAIRNKLTNLFSEDSVVIDMNGASVVPGDVLTEIKGQDVTVLFDLGEGVKWTINGMDITGDNIGDIDFGVKIGTNTIPVDVVNNVTGERHSIQISLAHNGDFGFTAILSVDMDKKNAGLFANLFYYNTDNDELEFICADEISEDGIADLTFTHASDYTIVIDTEPMDGSLAQTEVLANAAGADNTVVGSEKQNGATDNILEEHAGDTDAWSPWWIIIICGVIIAIGLGGFYVIRKKKQCE